jgi:hypothetical protein
MHYNDWTLGLTANIPLGWRFEHAAVLRAKLALAQGYYAVQREEQKARSFLMKAYRDVFENYQLVGYRRAQREAYAVQLDARFKLFRAGREDATIEFVLQAQQQWANALNQEYQAVVAYNNSLAAFQFAKGTIMQHDNVAVTEAGLPECAALRAVDNERERSKALVIRERENYITHAAPTAGHGVPWMPTLPGAVTPSVAALTEDQHGQPLPVPQGLEGAWLPNGDAVQVGPSGEPYRPKISEIPVFATQPPTEKSAVSTPAVELPLPGPTQLPAPATVPTTTRPATTTPALTLPAPATLPQPAAQTPVSLPTPAGVGPVLR